MLNKRCLEIIEYLIENNNTFDLKVMANKFGISERSIRYDMDNINYFFKKNNLNQLKKESKGTYHLNETTENLLEIIEILNIQFYTFSKAERINYIKSVCYFFTDVIRLHEISETLSVSISTVKLDLKDVKNHLRDNNLELIPLSKQGLILEGDEEKIRKMQLKFLLNYVKFSKGKLKSKNHSKETFGSKIVINEILLYFEDISIGDIEIFIKRIEKQLKIIISDEAYKVLKFYMMLSIIRLLNEKKIEKREENENFLKQTKEYNVLLKELPHLEENFKIKFNDSELLLLTELFLGSHSYNFNTSFFKNWIEIEMSIHKMIKEVGSAIGVDLIGDKILLDGLLNHLKPSIYRIKNDIVLENEMSNEVKLLYNELFEEVKTVCKNNLYNYIGKEIPDEEISFITIHFKIAIDRKSNIIKETKNILLVCGFGYGSSKLLSQKLQERYDVNIIDTLPYHKFLEIKKYDDIDLIITTLEIDDKIDYPLPIIKVHPIFSKGDKKMLEDYGLTEVRKKISMTKLIETIERECFIENEENLVKSLKKLLRNKVIDDREKKNKKTLETFLQPENIKFIDEVLDWKEAIRTAGEILEVQGIVTKGYIEDMVEAVNINGSYMIVAEKVALPHARTDKTVLKTGMGMLKLKKPVIFPGNKSVEIIIPFSSIDQSEHIEALTELVNLIEDDNFIEVARNCEDKFQIREFIIKKDKTIY